MSMFYCEYHDRVEDSDYVGFEVTDDDEEVCDQALSEIEELERESLIEIFEGTWFRGAPWIDE